MTTAALGSLLPLPVVLPIVGATTAPLLARLSVRLPAGCLDRGRVVFLGGCPVRELCERLLSR